MTDHSLFLLLCFPTAITCSDSSRTCIDTYPLAAPSAAP
nr:unnamed protein product [Callosobruchus analis]